MIPLKGAQFISQFLPFSSQQIDSSSQKGMIYSYFRGIFVVTDLKYKRTRKPFFIL